MGTRLRTGLAVTQLVLSLTLLIGALLFVSSLRNLRAVDAGFDPAGVTTYRFGTRLQGYDETRLRAFYRDLTARLDQVPQIEAVAVADGTPMLFGGITWPVEMPGQGRESRFPVQAQYVTPEYFHALGIQLRAGRTFTDDEVFRADETAVVASESLVRRLFGSPDVVGRALTFSATYSDPARDVRIVGVAEDVRLNDLAARPPEIVYRPMLEAHGTNDVLIVRSSSRTADAIAAVRAATASLDPALPVTMAEELNAAVSARLAEERLAAWVLGALAVLGFALAAIGIHGLVSQGVVERMREFGIRLSIGATRGQIVRLVLRSAVRLAAIGVPLGLLAAAASSRLVGSRLFGVEPLDAGLYATAVLALLIVVLLAGLAPALRASRANPVDVLRAE
jgi:predicted permease